MRVYAVVGCWSVKDDEGRILGESRLFEVFVNEQDAKRFIAQRDDQPHLYSILPRTLRTGWSR